MSKYINKHTVKRKKESLNLDYIDRYLFSISDSSSKPSKKSHIKIQNTIDNIFFDNK